MDSEKGNVKIGRKIECPQVLEKTGSSGWTRTDAASAQREAAIDL